MKIESIIKREGGTVVELNGDRYSFEIQPDGAHVAEVGNKFHVAALLAIPEGYRIYDPNGEAPAAPTIEEKTYEDGTKATGPGPLPEQSPAQSEALYGSNVHPSTFDINGATYTLGDVVRHAHEASGLSVEEWNALEDGTRADLIDEELDKLQSQPPAPPAPAADALDELKAQYKAKFGKAPHHKWDAARIREAIEA